MAKDAAAAGERAQIAVIGAGFGRTGTQSLYTALNQLGYRAFHMREVVQRGAHAQWAALGRGDVPVDTVGKLLRGYTATTDFPACIYYKELLAQNPDAKVVLTVRDADAWYRSARETIMYFENPTFLLKHLPPLRAINRAMVDMWVRPTFGVDSANDLLEDRDLCVRTYQRHIDEVKRTVPPAQLLVFEVKDGWAPLCRFLGVPVPSTPFPRTNETAEFQRIYRVMAVLDYALMAGLAVAVGWAAWTLHSHLGLGPA